MDRIIIVVLVLARGYFAFDKFVLTPRREAALVAGAAPNESRKLFSELKRRNLFKVAADFPRIDRVRGYD